MAIFFDAPVTPDALTAFVREVPGPADLGLTALFPRETSDDNTVDFAEIVRTNRAAKFRTFDGRIHVSERDTGGTSRVSLLPLSSSLGMGEYERLQLQFARTGGTNTNALAQSIYNDAQNLTNEVLNRLELAWGDVLTDGKLTIQDEGGYSGEADFGIPSSQIITAGTAWSGSSAPTFSNLIAWQDNYIANNGRPFGTLMGSQRILRYLQTSAEVINAVHGSAAGRTRVNINELNDLLSSEGLPSFTLAPTTKLYVDGAPVSVLPEDKLIMGPANMAEVGATVFGVSATALELVNAAQSDLSFEEAAGIVGVVIKDGPPFRQFTYVDAVAMPILKAPRLLQVADVF